MKLPSGASKEVFAGTERIDGYWATLRREVGRKSINTGLDMSQARQWLELLVRVHQWEYWNLDVDRFAFFGALVAARRDAAPDFF